MYVQRHLLPRSQVVTDVCSHGPGCVRGVQVVVRVMYRPTCVSLVAQVLGRPSFLLLVTQAMGRPRESHFLVHARGRRLCEWCALAPGRSKKRT